VAGTSGLLLRGEKNFLDFLGSRNSQPLGSFLALGNRAFQRGSASRLVPRQLIGALLHDPYESHDIPLYRFSQFNLPRVTPGLMRVMRVMQGQSVRLPAARGRFW
jgi:hypothetical protein